MIEGLIVAGAILASAAVFYFRRPKADIRVEVRTLVRAVEKRAQWDKTIATEHVKRARVKLALTTMFPKESDEWLDMIIEEAVFDMECSNLEASRGNQVRAHLGGEKGPDERAGAEQGEAPRQLPLPPEL